MMTKKANNTVSDSAKKLIENLLKENEMLKDKVARLNNELEFEKNRQNDGYEAAKKMISELEITKNEYENLIYELKQIKDKYKENSKELTLLKKSYKSDTSNIVGKIKRKTKLQ